MNSTIKKIAKKILLNSKVEYVFQKICGVYGNYLIGIMQIANTEFKNKEELFTIEGGFRKGDVKALGEVVQMVLKKNIMIAEVGSWTGMSTSVLAKSVADYQGKVFAVDHWLGSEGVPHHEFVKTIDIYSIFKRNMISSGVWNIVYPLVMDSQTASEIFQDGILDLVFIDADHRYENFKKDIKAWFPKIKKGGIICGHDCFGYYEDYPKELKDKIDKSLEESSIPVVGHPGIIKGLHDFFGKEYKIMPDSIIWYYVKKA